jgi:hypothetical protein
MTKDRLVEVLGKLGDGGESGDPGYYHDEIETLIGVVLEYVSQEQIDAAYAEIHEDATEE